MSNFNNKTAIVTGSASGIGRAIARALCRQGAHVYAADIQEQKLAEFVEEERDCAGSLSSLVLDVTKKEAFESAIQKVLADHGSLDIIVNNAGLVIGGDFSETSMEDIEKITQVNYWGTINGTKTAYDVMVAQGQGHIVNVASTAGVMPVPMSTAYATTKHAVVGLSRSLRQEAALYGVKVSMVFPGMVKSDLWDNAVNAGDYNYRKEMENTAIAAMTPDEAAAEILQGIERNLEEIIFPFRDNKLIIKLYRLMPGLMTRVVSAPLLRPLKRSLKHQSGAS